jgi:uncharacterized protein YheU (UPF0270 family)
MEIPHRSLKPETLRSVIEEFVLREGTDYGLSVYSLDQKVEQVYRQLERGDVVVVFDPEAETCDIVSNVKVRSR